MSTDQVIPIQGITPFKLKKIDFKKIEIERYFQFFFLRVEDLKQIFKTI